MGKPNCQIDNCLFFAGLLNIFIVKKKLLFILCLLLGSIRLFAQNGYIYIHTSTLDESSNPTGLNKGFAFTGVGSGSNPGTTAIAGFTLNDAPDYNTIIDVGVASTGTLFVTTSNGLYYRLANTAVWKLAPNTSGATKVDGCINDQAIYIPSGGATVQLFDIATNTSYQMMTGSFTDVAFDRANSRVVALASGTLYYKTLTGTTVNTIATVANSSTIAAARIDVDKNGTLLVASTGNILETVANYTTTPIISNLGAPAASGLSGTGTIAMYDVAAADDGTYIVTYGKGPYYYSAWRYNGAANNFINEPSSGLPNNITGGPGGEFWSTYYTISPGVVSLYTRMLSGTTATWFDDERVRTTANTNSQLLAVAPGTYTITETPNTPDTTWNLQKVAIYDPATTSTSTSNVANSTATITVAAGQTVHAIFQNYYNPSTVKFSKDCSATTWSENFGTGSVNLTTGHMIGATSYHYNGSSDGYFGIAGSAGGINDHTTGNGTGDFIWFNASYQQDVFYQRSFSGLVPGRPYTLTFWVNSYSTGSKANITAQVTDPASGALLSSVDPVTGATTPGTLSTGPISTLKTWIKETFTFTPGPSQTTANFSILNNGTGGDGNDVGIDDISVSLAGAPAVTTSVHNTCGGSSTITVTSPLGSAYQYSINGTTYQSSPTFSGLTQGTAYTVYTSYVGSTACASTGVVTTPNVTYTWKGSTTSSDPTVAANWVGGVAPPFDGSASIVIPVVASGFKYPILTANESIFSLTINAAGATTPVFNLGAYTLNVGCNIYNSSTGGILNAGTDVSKSTINWNGDSPTQTYTGNATVGSAKLGNMSVNNTYASGGAYGTVTISGGPIDIYNNLTMVTGLLSVQSGTSAGTLTLKSTASSSATVTALPATYPYAGLSGTTLQAITGNVNVERFITGGAGYRGYRLLSSPVYVNTVNGVNVIGLKYINTTVGSNYGALVGGVGGTANGFDVPNGQPTIYLYDETKMLNNSNYTVSKNIGIYSYTPISGAFLVNGYQFTTIYSGTTTPGVTIPVGNSYIFFFIGNNQSTVTSNTRVSENTTLTATGSLNQGTIPFKLWANNSFNPTFTLNTGVGVPGLHQVGNPYASSISLDQFYIDNYDATNNPINQNFYELVEPGQNYVSYNAKDHTSSSTKIGSTIVSGQGFIAGVTAANQTFTFKEDQKVNTQLTSTGTPALFLAAKLPTGLAGLHMQLTNDADSTQNIETGVYFFNGASDAYNIREDAADMGGGSKVSLTSFTSDNIKVGINELGSYLKTKRIRLYVGASASGRYRLDMADIKNIDTLYNVFLVDKLLKDSVNLQGGKRYDFAITTTDTTTFGANRFELAVELKPMAPYRLLSFTGTKAPAGIQLQWKTANEGSFTGFTLQKLSGTTFVGIDSLQSNGSGTYSYTDIKPITGVNTYRLMQNGITGNITYSDLVKVNTASTTTTGGDALSVYPNPAHGNINITTNASGSYKLNIYNSFGGVIKQQNINGTAWAEDVTAYNDGTYIIEMTDSKGKFIGKTKFVKVK